MPLNNPAAGLQSPLAQSGTAIDPNFVRALEEKLRALPPEDQATLSGIVNEQTVPALIKLFMSLLSVSPRFAGMLPGQQNTQPTDVPQNAPPPSPLSSTPIAR